MELEEAIETIKNSYVMSTKHCLDDENIKFKKAIETVLQAYKNLQEEYRQYREFICVTGGKDIDDITATQYIRIQQEGYLRGRKEEREKAKQFIKENCIPKKKIENEIEILKAQCGGNVFHIQQTLNAEIRLLQELLEEK